MWLCSMVSSSSSSSAELSVKKPGHTRSKPPGRRFGREGALSLGANQHECVYTREFARDSKVECVRRGEEWKRWRREWRETRDGGDARDDMC